jgi:hypothetical protein
LFPPVEDEKKDGGGAKDGDNPFRLYLKSSLEFFSSLAEEADKAWKR